MPDPKTAQPNPGSYEAIARGCTCPVLDNGRGRGAMGNPGQFWFSADCPLHVKGNDDAAE